MKTRLLLFGWVHAALAFLLLPLVAFAQTKPINNLVVQLSGTDLSGILNANGSSATGTITASGILDTLGSTQGDVAYRNASGWVVLPPGTSGFVLQTGGAAANPSWVAQTGGGGTPGGSTTQVQFNSSGSFAGSANFTFASNVLTNLNPSIGVTSTDGRVVGNNTAATSSVQQWSPRVRQYGNGWHTGSGGGTTEVDGYAEIRPVSGSIFPSFIWAWATAFNNGSGTDAFWTDGANFFSPNLVANNTTAASSSGGGSLQSKGGLSASGTLRGQAGTSGKYIPAGGALFDHFADVGNTTTTETDLYSDSVLGNTLAATGAKLYASYGLTIVSSATATREIRIYFAGSVIYDSTALAFTSGGTFTVDVWIIEDSSTSVRYRVIPHDGNGAGVIAVVPAVGKLTGLTLSGANILKITGQAASTGAATNDIVAILGNVAFFPAL